MTTGIWKIYFHFLGCFVLMQKLQWFLWLKYIFYLATKYLHRNTLYCHCSKLLTARKNSQKNFGFIIKLHIMMSLRQETFKTCLNRYNCENHITETLTSASLIACSSFILKMFNANTEHSSVRIQSDPWMWTSGGCTCLNPHCWCINPSQCIWSACLLLHNREPSLKRGLTPRKYIGVVQGLIFRLGSNTSNVLMQLRIGFTCLKSFRARPPS